MIKTLLECGADHGAFVVDSTPLHMAALGGATEVVDLLMARGRGRAGYRVRHAAGSLPDIVARPARRRRHPRGVREEDERLTSSRWEDTKTRGGKAGAEELGSRR